ncbi:MAG: DUF111 family protein, partial [Oscillospiraceae bacterium]|nr:DUF111 family protein [Oscillospiraceae bacterium]
KKGRPAAMVSALANPWKAGELAGVMMGEMGTLGVRYVEYGRAYLDRRVKVAETRYGPVRVKAADIGGSRLRSPEYEDCKAIALDRGVPIRDVYAEALRAMGAQEA